MSRQLLTIYGTEFDELDEEQAKLGPQKKPTAIQDQIATDEHGKRRFHGAFTGGFSAGYWNTVGSKEGWKPSEFRSSRDQRTNFNQSKPEDIMDAEDLGEFGIGARKIRQTATFANDSKMGKRRMAWEHDVTTSSSLAESIASVVKPAKSSIGAQMLHKMGWRQGRGIGLATVKETRTRGSGGNIQITLLFFGGNSNDADFDRQQAAKVAPGYELSLEDELVVQLTPCTGAQGLGYTGLKPTNVLDEKWGLLEASLKADSLKRKSKGIRGQAFGVGAFEEEDETVYTQFDMSQYDFALDGPGGSQEPSIQAVDFTFEEMPKKQNARKFYGAPRLPNGWKPSHKCIPIDVGRLPENLKNAISNLTIEQRARLLGEDRKASSTESGNSDKRKEGERRSRWDVKSEQMQIERFGDPNRVEFPQEPMKQKRFKEFLVYVRRGIPWPKPTDLSVWEWESEKKDFESKLTPHERALLPEVRSRAEPLAKSNLSLPIKELMANKFTAETGSSGHIGRKDEDKLAAVKMNMFGDRTRSVFEWYPDNMLAKRFNVPNPYPGATFSGCPHLQKVHKPATLVDLGLPNTVGELVMRKHESEKIVTEEVNEEFEEPEEKTDEIKQPASIFDAIFGDLNAALSEASSEEEDGGKEMEAQTPAFTNGQGELKARADDKAEPQEKILTVLDLFNDEEYGPAPPPDLASGSEGLTGFSVLRYLHEELKERKKHKKEKEPDHRREKKDKKEKKHSKKAKDKKVKKEKKSKKKHRHRDSSPESSASTDSVRSASPKVLNRSPPSIVTIE